MYNYFFDKDITVDNVNDLVDKLDNVEGSISLWFSTNGGSPDAMNCLIEYLNSRKDEIVITLTDWVMSAGTLLLTDFEGKIVISEGLDFLLFHLVDRESYSLRKSQISDDRITKQDFKKNKIFAKKLKTKGILNKKQIKQFLKGKDIILYQETFKKWKLCQ